MALLSIPICSLVWLTCLVALTIIRPSPVFAGFVRWLAGYMNYVSILKTQSSPRSKYDKPRGTHWVPAMLSNPDLPRSTATGELPTTCCLNKTLMSVGPRESILHCLELREGRHD